MTFLGVIAACIGVVLAALVFFVLGVIAGARLMVEVVELEE